MPSSEMLSSPGPVAEVVAPAAPDLLAAPATPAAPGDRTSSLRDRVAELLDRLEGELAHGDLFTAVPGIGPELAHRIHETLGIETLEELADVAHDGRLARVAGFGPHRVRAVCTYLDAALGRSPRPRPAGQRESQLRFGFAEPAVRPPVGLLLEIDETYRRLADDDRLPCIASRLDVEGHASLPVWHTQRDGWSFTARRSTTARSRALGRDQDWVVIHYEKDDREAQCTVVTEHQGELTGQRVIRGRERECASHYELHEVAGDVRAWAHTLAESA
jgi:DNA polymerase (family 10)